MLFALFLVKQHELWIRIRIVKKDESGIQDPDPNAVYMDPRNCPNADPDPKKKLLQTKQGHL